MNNLDANIVDSDNFDSTTFLWLVLTCAAIFVGAQLLYWVLYLRHFRVQTLDVCTGKRVRVTSLLWLWVNCLRLVRYYWGLSRSNSSGRFSQGQSGDLPEARRPAKGSLCEEGFSFDSGGEDFHADASFSRVETSDAAPTNKESSDTDDEAQLRNAPESGADTRAKETPGARRMKQTLSGEQDDLLFFHTGPAEGVSREAQSLAKERRRMENKKHIRLAAYFGQNLRRLCLLEVGLLLTMVLQFALISALGFALFPTRREFFGYLQGDFLYKDYLGLVTGNCVVFGMLIFGLSIFLSRREFLNQKVLYREVLRNENDEAASGAQVQRKFLTPHVVYFSGLDRQVKKSDFLEELREFVDFGRENESLSSENGSLILEETRGERLGNFSGFRRKGNLLGRSGPPDVEQSVDRLFGVSHAEPRSARGSRVLEGELTRGPVDANRLHPQSHCWSRARIL